MRLLERDQQLALLLGRFEGAAQRRGSCVLLYGEAGAGKTTLIQRFLDKLPQRTPRLVASCEALFVPRPMGPFADLAEHWPPSIAHALREGRMYPGLYADLAAFLSQEPMPKVLVIEDLHWADAGTLDGIRYLGRRMAGTGTLLMLSFRSDDASALHPLRAILGELPSEHTLRMEVPCLSRDAVEHWAQCAGRPAAGLYEVTGGNAFFVAEVLGGQPGTVPDSVRDAVQARLARLSPAARAVAELVATAPTAMERALIEKLVADAGPLLDECLDKRLLCAVDHRVAFRHELARQAVACSMPPSRLMQLHRLVFDELTRAPQTSLQRLVHHAEHAGLSDHVLALAPRAAASAARMSAHREAAGLYARALKHVSKLTEDEQAGLLEAAAQEFHIIGAFDDFMRSTSQALALRRQAQDPLRIGMNLRLLAFGHHSLHGDRAESLAAMLGAIQCLQQLPASTELAQALAQLSRLQSSWSEYDASVESADKALALAEALGDAPCLVDALRASGSAHMFLRDDPQALVNLRRALSMAIKLDLEGMAAPVYRTLQMVLLIHRHHLEALEVAGQGIAYCDARDLDVHRAHLLENRALSQVELGRWAEADQSISESLAIPALSPSLGNALRYLRARLESRRGDMAAQNYWRELRQAPQGSPMGYREPAILTACTEAAWLRGELEAARTAAERGAQLALAQSDARLLGPLLVWLHRLGAPRPEHDLVIAPEHASELQGDIRGAAACWAGHGCVYERALTLLHGDQVQLREALNVLCDLGATPAADIARARLRAMGVRGVQRGPQPRTREDPDGLTPRERSICELLCQGLSNADIAARLHRSERTVENHVASTLAKLGVRSRVELLARDRHARAADTAPG